MNKIIVATAALLFTGVLIVIAHVEDAVAKQNNSPVKMAQRLAELRKNVDDLAGTLDLKKEEMRGRIRSYATQKAEVEAEIQRAKMRLAQLEDSIERRRDKMEEQEESKDVLEPAVLETIGMLRGKIEKGMPFKRDERVAELDRLIRQIDERILHPINAFARLWDQTEDEFRLARESGIYKQAVKVEGKEVLADVIRIGMVMMYFKTKEGVFGKTAYESGKWSYEKITDPDEKRQVLYLFDSFKKQIRTGLFTIPQAIPQESR